MGEGRPPDIMNPEPRSGLFSSREAILETVIRRDHAQGSSVVGMIGINYFLLLFTLRYCHCQGLEYIVEIPGHSGTSFSCRLCDVMFEGVDSVSIRDQSLVSSK